MLRRADWRFLLPDPRPDRVACAGARPPLREAATAVSGRVVDPSAHVPCDLVVLSDPDLASLRAARVALAPGGSVYVEWGWRGALRPARARALLAAAGFDGARCYRVWPSRARPLAWVPLGAPGALRHLLTLELRPGYGVRHRLAATARRLLRAAVLRRAVPYPLCAVATRPADETATAPGTVGAAESPGPRRPDAAEPAAVRAFRTAPGALPADAAPPLSWLLLTPGGRSVNKVVGLMFAEPDSRPRVVVKAARVPESTPALAREAAVLRALARGGGAEVPGVPRLVFGVGGGDGMELVGETALGGVSLLEVLRPSRHRELARRGEAWLSALAAATRRPAADTAWERVARGAFERFTREFGPVADAAMLRDTRDRLEAIGPLPVVCEHRDCSPWNVLVAGDRLAVLDWESAEPCGVPGLDLVYFLAYLGFFVDRARDAAASAASYRAALRPDTPAGAIRRECLDRYWAAAGLDATLAHPLALLTWVLHAASEYRQFRADVGDATPTPAQLRGSVFLALWSAELRHGGPA